MKPGTRFLIIWIAVSLPAMGIVFFSQFWVGGFYEAQGEEQITQTLAFVRSQLEDRRSRLQGVMDQVEKNIRSDQEFAFKLLVEKNPGDPGVVNLAASKAKTFGLDLLSLADARGKTLSCAHWPASFGMGIFPKLELLRNAPDAVSLYVESVKDKKVLSLQTVKEFQIGGLSLTLAGGYRIHRSFLERISLSDRMVLILVFGDQVLQSHPVGEFYHGGLLGGQSGKTFARIDLDEKPYLAGLTKIPVMGKDGPAQAELVAAVSVGTVKDIRAGLLSRSLMIGAALSLLVSLVLQIGCRRYGS